MQEVDSVTETYISKLVKFDIDLINDLKTEKNPDMLSEYLDLREAVNTWN